jgi:tRNA modification GTPase
VALDLDDTICAIASAPGGALRGIVRVSGPDSLTCVSALIRPVGGIDLTARAPSCRRVSVFLSDVLGEAPAILYLWPTSRSYTRQPSAELHLPGSPPILEAALAALCEAGARLARPGEFTLRALLAGRLDLTQAEAVLGVIDARSKAELDVALGQLAGGLARPLKDLRERLLDLLAHLEAGLDFADEDIEFIAPDELASQLDDAAGSIEALVARMQSRGESAEAPRVVLVGLPNVGKSSLLNALAGDEAVIVSETAGTTRDFVARRLSLGQQDCILIDTAGVVPGSQADELAIAAQRMTGQQHERADLVLLCLDASREPGDWEAAQLKSTPPTPWLFTRTKCDLASAVAKCNLPNSIATSSKTGLGIDELRQAIAGQLAAGRGELGVIAGTADRCRESLRLAGEALSRARATITTGHSEELAAAEIRVALEHVGRVVGAVFTDDILDRIFSRFCIGK